MSVNEKMAAIANAIRGKTGGTEMLTLDDMAAAIAGLETGGGASDGVKVTEYVVTENADRSLWLNEQQIKLVKGVNLLVSSNLDYKGANQTLVQGAVTLMLILWDGMAASVTAGTNSQTTASHVRGFQIPCSAYTALASITPLAAGNTSAAAVNEDGLLTCTTTATGVTTGNYNNSFIEGGYTYRLLQAESEVVC